MNRRIAVLYCLMLAVSPPLLAQSQGGQKPPTASQKQQAEKGTAKFAQCANSSRAKQLKIGTREFDEFMRQCLNG